MQEESWATRMIQAAEMEAVRLRASAQVEYEAKQPLNHTFIDP